MTQEHWRPIPGFVGIYEVSDHGRVRSLDRTITFSDGRSRFAKGRVLKPWVQKDGGYLCVILKDGSENRRKALVQILTLEAFVGPRPSGLVGCHNDDDPLNNHINNLRWDTYGGNNSDMVRHGSHPQASKTKCPSGHEYSAENTRIYIYRGWRYRYCRTCQNEASRAFKARARRRAA